MHIEAVIGANYGDEGKGLFTEHLCRTSLCPIVVLSNGGCQRGHTVNNAEHGIRHVFHHFGSGTLVGAPSIYAKTFLLNPIKYVEEKKELESLGVSPRAFRVPGCILQLPGDMFINQMVEKSRSMSGTKHGSCGWGIWETIVRNKIHPLSFEDFASMDCAAKKQRILEEIEHQMYWRLIGVNGSSIDYDALELLMSDGFIKHFIDDFNEMEKSCKMLDTHNILENDFTKYGLDAKTIVVECGQGLLLDKKYAPIDENGRTDIHTTPSKCGIDGVAEALGRTKRDGGAWDFKDITANYITRTYFTRHGAGPFPEETEGFMLEDKTNVYNEFQDSMRFGKMDDNLFMSMHSRCCFDGCVGHPSVGKVNIAMTHCNEAMPSEKAMSHASFFSFEDDSRKFLRQSDMFKK